MVLRQGGRWLLLAVALATLAAVPAAGVAAPSTEIVTCTFHGPPYVATTLPDKPTFNVYNLDGRNVSCAFAVPWATRLAAKPALKQFFAIDGGPPGFDCTDRTPNKGPDNPTGRVSNGFCQNGAKEQSFSWYPQNGTVCCTLSGGKDVVAKPTPKTPSKFTLSGKVSTQDCGGSSCVKAALRGVRVTAKGPAGSGSAMTAADGTYSIALKKGRYRVVPSLGGRGFKPGDQDVDLTGDRAGVDFATCDTGKDGGSRSTSALVADYGLCYTLIVRELGNNFPVYEQYIGVGWNKTGGPITLSWEGKQIRTLDAAAEFEGIITGKIWPHRTGTNTTDASCWGTLTAKQGSITRSERVDNGPNGVVIFVDADPRLKIGTIYCDGEEDTLLQKTPGIVVAYTTRGTVNIYRDGQGHHAALVTNSLCLQKLKDRAGHVVITIGDGKKIKYEVGSGPCP